MTDSGTVDLYQAPDGTPVVWEEFLAFRDGSDRELKKEVVRLVEDLDGLGDGRLDPVQDRYDKLTDPKPWLYWRPKTRIGFIYHISDEQNHPRVVVVLRVVAKVSMALPAVSDIRLARQRLAAL